MRKRFLLSYRFLITGASSLMQFLDPELKFCYNPSTMRLGVHVSIAGHIYEAVDRAVELGCNTFQIFPRNPQRASSLTENLFLETEEFKTRRKGRDIKPVVVHMPYVVNLASAKERLFELSVKSYIEDIGTAAQLGAEYLVTHLGSYVGSSEAEGLERFSQGINKILGNTQETVTILLENTAGAGSHLGAKIEHLQYVMKQNSFDKRLGMCLDTAHTYAASFDIAKKKGLDDFLDKIDKLIGAERLKVIHLNDSKAKLGSHIDRHENIGKGFIGLNGFHIILNHPVLRELPFILETPKKSNKDDLDNLRVVRSLVD